MKRRSGRGKQRRLEEEEGEEKDERAKLTKRKKGEKRNTLRIRLIQ